jgi:hypothetical protein
MSLLAGQVHCLSATTPERIFEFPNARVIHHWKFVIRNLKLARRRGAAPRGLSFGNSAAQAGARRITDL